MSHPNNSTLEQQDTPSMITSTKFIGNETINESFVSFQDVLHRVETILFQDPNSSTLLPPSTSPATITTTATNDRSYTIVALTLLENLQERIHSQSIFSTNETLEDIPTGSLPLFNIEYLMGKTYLQLPTVSSMERKIHVQKAIESFHSFLHKCDTMEGIFHDSVRKEYHALLDSDSQKDQDEEEHFHKNKYPLSTSRSAAYNRETKIARFRSTKLLKEQKEHLQALQQRRNRLGVSDREELEGYDDETLLRSITLAELNIRAFDAMEEIYASWKEMEVLQMAVQMEQNRNTMSQYKSSDMTTGRGGSETQSRKKSLEVTRVTSHPITGELIMKREEIKSSVFRAGWNQPTMSLDEFARLEVADALDREKRQQETEFDNMLKPRRYDQLVKDGMDDNADLVDASAEIDRKWDDWKDAHPAGSGNKMGDRGDRNF